MNCKVRLTWKWYPGNRREGWGWSTNTVQPETQERGAIPHRYSVPGFGNLFAVSPDTPQRSCLNPEHGYPVLSPHTARPLWRGREEAGGRAVGVFPRIPFNQRHRRQGRGMLHPPPRQPLPHGVILHRYSVPVRMSRSAARREHPTEILLPPPVHGYPVNRHPLARPTFRALAVWMWPT